MHLMSAAMHLSGNSRELAETLDHLLSIVIPEVSRALTRGPENLQSSMILGKLVLQEGLETGGQKLEASIRAALQQLQGHLDDGGRSIYRNVKDGSRLLREDLKSGSELLERRLKDSGRFIYRYLEKGSKGLKAGWGVMREHPRAIQAREGGKRVVGSFRGGMAKEVIQHVGSAFKHLEEQAKDISQRGRSAKNAGVDIGELDSFVNAASVKGVGSREAQGSVIQLADSIRKAQMDGSSAVAQQFKSLDIELNADDGEAKNALAIMLELSAAVEGMSRSQAAEKLSGFGIVDQSMIDMLVTGRDEMERQIDVQKQHAALTQSEADDAQQFVEVMNEFRGVLGQVGKNIALVLLPPLSKLMGWLTNVVNWARDNKEFVTGFFAGLAAVIAAVYIPTMVAAAAATLAATWPLLLIGAAIVAVIAAAAWLYQELKRLSNGEASFFSGLGGKILDAIPGKIKDAISGLWALISWPVKAANAFWNELFNADPDTSWIERLLNAFSAGFKELVDGYKTYLKGMFGADFFQPILDMWDVLMDFEPSMEWLGRLIATGVKSFNRFFDSIRDGFKQLLLDMGQILSSFNPFNDIVRSTVKVLGIGGGDETSSSGLAMGEAFRQMEQASQSPLNSVSSNVISHQANSSREQNVSVGDITISTQASDPQEVGRFVGEVFRRELKLDNAYASGEER